MTEYFRHYAKSLNNSGISRNGFKWPLGIMCNAKTKFSITFDDIWCYISQEYVYHTQKTYKERQTLIITQPQLYWKALSTLFKWWLHKLLSTEELIDLVSHKHRMIFPKLFSESQNQHYHFLSVLSCYFSSTRYQNMQLIKGMESKYLMSVFQERLW